jgi:hypothetical protein
LSLRFLAVTTLVDADDLRIWRRSPSVAGAVAVAAVAVVDAAASVEAEEDEDDDNDRSLLLLFNPTTREKRLCGRAVPGSLAQVRKLVPLPSFSGGEWLSEFSAEIASRSISIRCVPAPSSSSSLPLLPTATRGEPYAAALLRLARDDDDGDGEPMPKGGRLVSGGSSSDEERADRDDDDEEEDDDECFALEGEQWLALPWLEECLLEAVANAGGSLASSLVVRLGALSLRSGASWRGRAGGRILCCNDSPPQVRERPTSTSLCSNDRPPHKDEWPRSIVSGGEYKEFKFGAPPGE